MEQLKSKRTSLCTTFTEELASTNTLAKNVSLARTLIRAQAAYLTHTLYCARLACGINFKFPNIGKLLLKCLAVQFKRELRRNDKALCISSATFIAHLVSEGVANVNLALEILALLIQRPTIDFIELFITVLKKCSTKLTQVRRGKIEKVFKMLRSMLRRRQLDKRVQRMVKVIFKIRKEIFKDNDFAANKCILLDDGLTYFVTLDDTTVGKTIRKVLKFNPNCIVKEDGHLTNREGTDDEDAMENEEGDEDHENEDDDVDDHKDAQENKEDSGDNCSSSCSILLCNNDSIVNGVQTNFTAYRRPVYMNMYAWFDLEEFVDKLIKMPPNLDEEFDYVIEYIISQRYY